MAIIHNPDSEYSREMQQWNTQKQHGGKNANGFEPFPAMLYKAFARDNGKVMCGDPLAAVGDAVGEAFSRSCQLIVQNEYERDNAVRAGWALDPDLAMAQYEREMRSIAEVTAQRHYADQGMSELARAEATQADNATHEQVPSLPSKRKAGRPRKVV